MAASWAWILDKVLDGEPFQAGAGKHIGIGVNQAIGKHS